MPTVDLVPNAIRNEIELYIDQQFVASWVRPIVIDQTDLFNDHYLRSFIEKAYEAGKRARSKEIKTLIG